MHVSLRRRALPRYDAVARTHTLNRAAYEKLRVDKRLDVIPGATHLFEEPGALERVAVLVRAWFEAGLNGRASHTLSQGNRS
jgi:hypothetical protein